jgi:hypothetical protein
MIRISSLVYRMSYFIILRVLGAPFGSAQDLPSWRDNQHEQLVPEAQAAPSYGHNFRHASTKLMALSKTSRAWLISTFAIGS